MKTNLIQKISILLFCVSVITVKSFAQGVYVNAGFGYNLAAGKTVIGTNSNSAYDENVYGSFGKGFDFGAGVGYMFTEHFGAEIGLSYLIGSEYEFTTDEGGISVIEKVKGKMLRITPALKVSTGGALAPYAKFGLVMGLSPKADVTLSGSSGGASLTGTEEITGGSSMGWMGAFGIDFKINDRVAVYAELNSINQTWAPERNDYVFTATMNGSSDTEVGSVVYVDRTSGSGAEDLKKYFSFSSFGINAGIKLSFGSSGK